MMNLVHDIDALSATTTHHKLVVEIQKILHTIAYYISQSEAAILECREGWHDEYTKALYHDAGKSSVVAPNGGCSERRTAVSERKTKSRAGRRGSASRGVGAKSTRRPATRTEAARPYQANIPASLRAIMDGTHPSFGAAARPPRAPHAGLP